MQGLRQKTLDALSKLLVNIEQSLKQSEHNSKQQIAQNNQNQEQLKNPEDDNNSNHDQNDENKQQQNISKSVYKLSDLIQQNSQKLKPQQKMLLDVTYQNQMDQLFNLEEFKRKVIGSIKNIQIQSSNQFEHITENPFTQNNIDKIDFDSKITNKKTKKNNINMRYSTKKTQPAVQSHPEYYRVDQQLVHRLFLHYRTLPLGISRSGALTFQQKQHSKESMNYHKVLEIFKDAGITLQINQKLLILRSIKKFAFNQNLVSKDQFSKIFKVIIHGLGYKEKIFEELLSKKAANGSLYGEKRKKKSQTPSKGQRIYRFKTESAIPNKQQTMIASKRDTSHMNLNNLQHLNYLNERSRVSSQYASSNVKDSDVLKQDKKVKMNKEKNGKNTKKISDVREARSGTTGSYLLRAMDGQKISKITWDSLFTMKQNNMHFNIIIPDIVKGLDELEQF